jgi:hypothetical protein
MGRITAYRPLKYFLNSDYRFRDNYKEDRAMLQDTTFLSNDGLHSYTIPGSEYSIEVQNFSIAYTVSKTRPRETRHVSSAGARHLWGKKFVNGKYIPIRHDPSTDAATFNWVQRPFRYNDCSSFDGRLSLNRGIYSYPYVDTFGHPGTLNLPADPGIQTSAHYLAKPYAMSSLPFEVTKAGTHQMWEDLCNTALAKLSPSLVAVELVQDVAQFYQITSLFKNAASKVLGAPSWIKKIFRLPLRSKSKVFSEEFLEYIYGWKPFLADIRGIFDSFKHTFDRIDKWNQIVGHVIKSNGKIQDINFSTSGTHVLDSNRRIRWTISQVGSIHGSMTYTPLPFTELDKFGIKWKGVLQSLGIRPDAEIIWDLLPLSFVVDWFFNVGEWLHQFRFDLLDLRYKMLDFCLGLKQEIVITTEYEDDQYVVYFDPSVGHNIYQRMTFPKTVETFKTFERLVSPPFEASLQNFKWKRLTSGHLWLGINLINANL